MKDDHLGYSVCPADMIALKKTVIWISYQMVEVSPMFGSSHFSQQLRTAV